MLLGTNKALQNDMRLDDSLAAERTLMDGVPSAFSSTTEVSMGSQRKQRNLDEACVTGVFCRWD
jgi:hypothetical protein